MVVIASYGWLELAIVSYSWLHNAARVFNLTLPRGSGACFSVWDARAARGVGLQQQVAFGLREQTSKMGRKPQVLRLGA